MMMMISFMGEPFHLHTYLEKESLSINFLGTSRDEDEEVQV